MEDRNITKEFNYKEEKWEPLVASTACESIKEKLNFGMMRKVEEKK